jgi:ABC-2 type transport system permease protein
MTGTVFDIGYQRYEGGREGRGRARKAMYKNGLRVALGLGRGGRAKVLPFAFILVLAVIGLIMALVAGAVNRYFGPGVSGALNLPSHSDYNGIASIIMFVFAALVGPELLCRDRRERVINLYLVRPLTGSDYILCRWAAFVTVMTAAACLPQLILFIGLSMSDPAPTEYLRQHWLDVPKFLAAGLAMALYATTLALFTASFTSRRAYASVFLVGLFLITTPFTVGLASEMGGTAGQWISMFNLSNIPLHVNDIIFGEVSALTKDAPAGELSKSVRVCWWLAWTAVPAFLLWTRYRKLTP